MKTITLKISALALSLMLVCPAFSQITLKYNFTKGEILKQNTVATVAMIQNIMDQEIKMNTTVTAKLTYEVKEARDDGYTIEARYKEMKMSITPPGMERNLSFDANTTDSIANQQNLGPMLKAMIDKPLEIILAKTGETESVKGMDKLYEAMLSSLDESIPAAQKQQLTGIFEAQYSDKSLSQLFAQYSGNFPDKPVSIGDSWSQKRAATMANFAVTINTKTTLKSVDGNVATLDIEGSISSPEEAVMEMNGIKIKVSLNGDVKGVTKVNKDTGWMISSEIKQNLAGEIEATGMKIPLTLTIDNIITGE